MGLPLTASARALPQPELAPATGGGRAALRQVLREFIGAGPVFVSFSGGRDSSAVLAVATSVARECGAALPVPVTYRYPGNRDADEDDWQDLVLRHIGLTDRVVLDITHQQRLLGRHVQESMATRGLVWPVTVNLQHEMFSLAGGGVLLTGEGGDELFRGRRSAPIAKLRRTVRRRQRPGGDDVRAVMRALRPQRRAERDAQQVADGEAPWLRPGARDRFVETISSNMTDPLRWDRSVWHGAQRPHTRAVYHNLDLVAQDYDVQVHHPLLAPEFVSAWMSDGGRLGFTGRTDAMRHLFSDVLPEPILGRSTKAFFDAAHMGPLERGFARRWDGQGIDPEHTDPEVLRATWLNGDSIGQGDTALMAAWMASEGLPLEGPPQ
ncbi:asparagine synthase-related protein [Georgenia sp. MJ173]|uniref:asparagine synthase-related protein n=1 Tax=Georgenia sunbinii TaxID=3117728 RepID=UPI002F26CA4E